jgi:hypothetical protein
MWKTTLFSILFAGSLAYADMVTDKFEISFSQALGLVNYTSDGEVSLILSPETDKVIVRVGLIAESPDALETYKSMWELKAHVSGQIATVGIGTKNGMGISNCRKSIGISGRKKIKGTCVEEISIIVPANLSADLQANRKTVVIHTAPAAAVESRAILNPEVSRSLARALKDASFSSDRRRVVTEFVQTQLIGKNLALDTDQIVLILEATAFDDEKIASLRILKPYILDINQSYSAILTVFDGAFSKQDAGQILMGN